MANSSRIEGNVVRRGKTPAEDFATGMVTYRHPDGGQLVKAQFTGKCGLRVRR